MTISNHMTLMEFIRELLGMDSDSIQLRDYFQQNPQAALAEHGLGHLTAEDVHDALVLVQDNDTVSFDRDYNTGSGGIDWSWTSGGLAPTAHHAGTQHVTNNHVTNNVDDRDTILDQSVNQHVETHGGDFGQSIDNNSVNATGDRAVAAGGDITDSTITTGSGNVVGDGNQVVSGSGNNVAFGSGSANRDVDVDHGSGFSGNGPATGNASTNGSHNRDWSEDNDRTEIDNSHNVDTDNSTSVHADDHSQTHIGSHNDLDLHFG